MSRRPAVAVVGMGCRYPGAADPAELWQAVLAGRRAFRRIPRERLRVEDYAGEGADSLYVREAAVVDGWEFDRAAYRVSGESFRAADPAHWLALDTAARALADAGFPGGAGLPREATGVVVGNSLTGEISRAQQLRLRWPYVERTLAAALDAEGWPRDGRDGFLARLEERFKAPFPAPGEETLAGGLANTIAGRIANHFDLGGGGFTVDGACSSSLLAVAQAASALAAGELGAAVVGGVDLSLDPFELVGFSRAGAFARGRMRVFDRRSAGFLPGEGAGFVVLVPLAAARRQGLRVRAVLRGWGVSSDGAGGLTRPEPAGQLRALARAYRGAGFGPDAVAYFEAHGTGTAVGDAAELAALDRARREAGAAGAPPAAVGSIKALVGHTKAAAGVAGLIKAALAVEAGVLPATVGCEEPQELVGGRDGGAEGGAPVLRVLDRAEPWPAGAPRRAGVSSFGFGGINAHVVVEAAPGRRGRRRALSREERRLDASRQDVELLLVAAPERAALAARLRGIAARVGGLSHAELGDLAAELAEEAVADSSDRAGALLATSRDAAPALEGFGPTLPWRAAVVAALPGEAAERLAALADRLQAGEEPVLDPAGGVFAAPAATAPPRLGLLFPGQGAAARRDGGEWARRFEEVDELYRRFPLAAGDPVSTEVAQPALALAALAGLRVLRRLGLVSGGEGTTGARAKRGAGEHPLTDGDRPRPASGVSGTGPRTPAAEGSFAVAVGHSVGELAALHVAGWVDARDLLRLSGARGRAMAAAAATAPAGGMTALAAGAEEAERLLAGLPAVVAGDNAPRQTVVAGPRDALAEVERRAAAAGVRATRLPVAHAFHSPAMAGAAEELRAALAVVRWRRPAAGAPRMVSTVTGGPLVPGDDPAPLLDAQLTAPVRFRQAIAAAAGEGVDLWIEVGPGRVSSDLAERNGIGPAVALDVGGGLSGLLAAAGAAWTLGAPVDPQALFRDRFTRPLPAVHRFLANPCESAPLAGRRVASPSTASSAVAPTLPARMDGNGWSADPAPRSSSLDAGGSGNDSAPRPAPGQPHSTPEAPAAPSPDAAAVEPREVVRRLVARRAELPLEAVEDRLRLLSDLHLNSIAVGQLVVEAARSLGAPPPASPTDYADATVAEVAEALAGRAGDGGGDGEPAADRHPPGVDTWVRCFERVLVERPRPARQPVGGPLRVLGVDGDRLHDAIAVAASATPHEERRAGAPLLVVLPPRLDAAALDLLAAAARVAFADRTARVVLVHRGVGAGFLRTLHLERNRGEAVCVELPEREPDPAALPALAAAVIDEACAELGARGYAEAVLDAEGLRRTPVLRPIAEPAVAAAADAHLLGPSDVLLVTGGGRGIAAEAAFRLAKESGAALALVGRSRPEESAELAANLERFTAAGLRVVYRPADVADADAVRRAVAAAQAELGPVTAVLHGAGVNRPRPITALSAADLAAGWAVKVEGLAHVLAALDPERLRLLVAFGSVIAETGLPGEADYALANEGLARAVERFAAAHARCRCRAIEWSVWSGIGMGERLGTLESLLARGITPIPPDRGLAVLADLVARPEAPTTAIVAGRLGDPPTVDLAPEELPFLRFLERVRVHVPGVELVVDCELAAGSDPYLDEHVFAGERLFPAVLGLEAMAQVATALAGRDGGAAVPVFEQVRFARPVAVPAGETATLRLAALARRDGRVEVVLRSSTTEFAVDCFRAVCRFGGRKAGQAAPADPSSPPASSAPLPLEPSSDLYGPILFHQGRFRRLAAYRRLTASECEAEIAADGDRPWFGRHLPGALLLGDPAARDAAIHAVQACIPHATVLPTGVERLVAGVLSAGAAHRVEARERSRDGRDLVYDVEVRDLAGRLVERWEGLALHAVDELPPPERWPAALLAPYLERRLAEWLPPIDLRVALSASPMAGRNGSPPASGRNGGPPAAPRRRHARRRPDGRPDPEPDGRVVSRSRGAGLELAIDAPGAAGCDLEPVAARAEADWRELLGAGRFRLARLIADEAGEDLAAAATRVWSAVEAAKKAGLPVDAPFVLDAVRGGGWVLLRAGGAPVATFVAEVAGAAVVACAFAWAGEAEPAAAPPPARAAARPAPALPASVDRVA